MRHIVKWVGATAVAYAGGVALAHALAAWTVRTPVLAEFEDYEP